MINNKLLFFILIFVAFLGFVVAEDIPVNAKVVVAQEALNTPGFDSSSAYGIEFSDSIDPSTGALTISQTDVSVPGLGENNIVLSRRYSSNIFLNINAPGPNLCDGPTELEAGINNQGCDNCEISSSYSSYLGFEPNSCYSPSGDAASWIRSKYLGRGWTMNYMENRYKDVTPLVFSEDMIDYTFVPARGINSQSLVVNNNEMNLIVPSLFKQYASSNQYYDGNFFYWGLDLSLNLDESWENELVDVYDKLHCSNAPDFVCRQSHAFDRLEDTSSRNEFFYVAYTQSLSPVWIRNYVDVNQPAPFGVTQEVLYPSKDGKVYFFNHKVNFCSEFDELPSDESGACTVFSEDNFFNLVNWAENPYVGVHPTAIRDSFGNTIDIYYKGENNPFIDYIEAPGGRTVEFKYDSGTYGAQDINTRVEVVAFKSPKGNEMIYRKYVYHDSLPLLRFSYLSTDPTPFGISYGNLAEGESVIPGTVYEYVYDEITQELSSVRLPTGASIYYTYEWTDKVPAIDGVRGDISTWQTALQLKPKRRVVVERKLVDGGYCPDGNGGLISECVWTYDYSWQTSGDYYGLTTVTDPYGITTEYKTYPTTTPTLTHGR
ncbi:MAG: hypothetical protein ABIH59_02220 [archaeon]